MDITKILGIIVENCEADCKDFCSTMSYFLENHKDEFDIALLGSVVASFNFDMVRKHKMFLSVATRRK